MALGSESEAEEDRQRPQRLGWDLLLLACWQVVVVGVGVDLWDIAVAREHHPRLGNVAITRGEQMVRLSSRRTCKVGVGALLFACLLVRVLASARLD